VAIERNRAVFGKVAEHERDCQRCGQRFTAQRVVAYCLPCWRAKRTESHAAYVRRVAERAAGNRPGVARAEDWSPRCTRRPALP